MAWHAKPSGSYGAYTVEGIDNIFEINNNLQSFNIAAISGIISPDSSISRQERGQHLFMCL